MSQFRTKFVVEQIEGSSKSPNLGIACECYGSPYDESLPQVISADMPEYPFAAVRGGISGEVALKVVARDGAVESIQILGGDRILASSAETNVREWRFNPDGGYEFQVAFEFVLERMAYPANPNPRVELSLPSHVRITASRYDEKRWASLPILVDVVETVNWSGANTSWSDSCQGDFLVSRSPGGAAAFETLFHEASHILMDRGATEAGVSVTDRGA